MESLTVSGGSNAIKGKLSTNHGWDGNAPFALLSHRLGVDGEIQSTNWHLFGSLRPIVWPINNIWAGTLNNILINIDLKDLAMFEFPANSNISHWVDSVALRVSYIEKKAGGVRSTLDEVSALTKGIGAFSMRAHIIPTSTRVANVWVTVTPFSVTTLKDKLGTAKLNSPQIPTISLPLARVENEGTPTKSVEATLGVPEPQGLGLGIEAAALIDVTASPNAPVPDSQNYKEATICAYRSVVSVRTSTAKSVVSRLDEFIAGSVANLRQPNEVFKEFINTERPTGS